MSKLYCSWLYVAQLCHMAWLTITWLNVVHMLSWTHAWNIPLLQGTIWAGDFSKWQTLPCFYFKPLPLKLKIPSKAHPKHFPWLFLKIVKWLTKSYEKCKRGSFELFTSFDKMLPQLKIHLVEITNLFALNNQSQEVSLSND